MATEACRLFSSTWGVGITGYAAPLPEWNVNNTLFAWIALAYRGNVVLTKKIELKKADMKKVQQTYVKNVLAELNSLLIDPRDGIPD